MHLATGSPGCCLLSQSNGQAREEHALILEKIYEIDQLLNFVAIDAARASVNAQA